MQCNLAPNGCRTAMLSGGALVILEVRKACNLASGLHQQNWYKCLPRVAESKPCIFSLVGYCKHAPHGHALPH